ncbi:intraflagellar transport protein 57 homolog isoform X1 [Mercenaria mercenaria]|uniref:intraflagellar transport protein 57 homolog isoform X1 n=1 Tax=Mercenaria mercenaria TaxID=6596 RepID=UPI00234E90D2|nr:intraflagellar transport protein 57 homolog isoform X1 [Mercenaria mercenaria]XP_053408904.1 intraflagellar transport protein 57 homolog isoform X1 [Mercenaria mercenaria]
MSDDKKRGEDAVEDGGPGLVYMPFVVNEELVDKLRLLNYETEFIKPLNMKSMSRHYFAIGTNPGEQFFMFTSLAAWLLRTAGRNFEQPQEYDDPNATISSIIAEVKRFGQKTQKSHRNDKSDVIMINNYSVDFPPSKLKQGCGEHCLYVLDRLADEALKHTNFRWGRPEYPEEELEEENIVEDDAELTLNKVEDNIFGMHDDDEEFEDDEPMMDLEGLRKLNQKANDEKSKPDEIMESTTDAADWKLEVERVLPQLKVTIRTDNKDWRVHVEQMHQHKDGIETSLTETKTYLDKLHDEITRTLEKINSREKYINNQLEHHLVEFRGAQDSLAETKERYRQASGGVTERSRLLAEVTEELEKVKMEMEDRGSSMTDGAPLVKIKQSITQLKKENTQMDIRQGVVEHILLQAKLKDKTSQNKQAHSTNPSSSQYPASY